MGKSLAEARSSVVKLGREIVSAYRDYQDAYKKEFEFHPERMSKNSLPAGKYFPRSTKVSTWANCVMEAVMLFCLSGGRVWQSPLRLV